MKNEILPFWIAKLIKPTMFWYVQKAKLRHAKLECMKIKIVSLPYLLKGLELIFGQVTSWASNKPQQNTIVNSVDYQPSVMIYRNLTVSGHLSQSRKNHSKIITP